jgi:hypothetical protein
MDWTDNIVLGAIRGSETSTATAIDWFNASMQDTAFGRGNGVISEFRVDNYIWSEDQVLEDLKAQRPRFQPNVPVLWKTSKHLGDKIKDGSEGEFITYEDVGVVAGQTYSYALDALDSLGNRSVLSATASISAGDKTAPVVAITNMGYTISKDNHVTYHWTNPSDTDFAYTEVFNPNSPYETWGQVYGDPGKRSSWSAGFIGYGSTRAILIRGVDYHGNKQGPALEKTITARTKKGPLRRIDGTFMFNKTGLNYGLDTYRVYNGLSWAKVGFSVSTPDLALYSDMQVTIYPKYSGLWVNSGFPTPILAPIKMGSVRGFTRDTSYYVYLTDSAGLKRQNALMLGFAQKLSSADSVTAYPLGKWWTGNTTVTGYFIPDIEAGHTLSGEMAIYGRVQDRTGNNYFDLQRGVLRNQGARGDYMELTQTALKYYNVGSKTTYEAPKAVVHIPAHLVNMGRDNTFQAWGLGSTLPRVPSVHLQPARTQTYSNAGSFGSTRDQYLEMGVAYVTTHTVRPYTRLVAQATTIETHTSNSTRKPYDTSLGGYNLSMYDGYKVRKFSSVSTSLVQEYFPYFDALDTSQQGCNSVTRLDIQVIAVGSGAANLNRTNIQKIRQKFIVDYDSAQGQHGPPMYSVGNNYRDELVFDMTNWEGGVQYFNWTKTWSTPAAWKPKIAWWYSWLVPNYIPSAAGEPSSQTRTGESYTKRMWLGKVTYYNTTGGIIEQTGIGVADAIVII